MIPQIVRVDEIEPGFKVRLPVEQETRDIPYEVVDVIQISWASAGESFAVSLKNTAFGQELTEIMSGDHEYVQYVHRRHLE